MLFFYKYVHHDIEKLQSCIDFLFLNVWCKAYGDFSIEKVKECDMLYNIIKFYYEKQKSNTTDNDYFYGPVKEIYELFAELNEKKKEQIAKWYSDNNKIKELCKGNIKVTPVIYETFKEYTPILAPKLKTFFENLYTNILSLEGIKKEIGELSDHYKNFLQINKPNICPYCGIHKFEAYKDKKRSDYDHYLPKSKYIFNSINLRNLTPICGDCNRKFKSSRDPLHDKNDKRRKAFYSYDKGDIDIKIGIELKTDNIDNITEKDIKLTIETNKYKEEVETWKECFGIEDRYIAGFIASLGGSDAEEWLTSIQDWIEVECEEESEDNELTIEEKNKIKRKVIMKTIKVAKKSLYSKKNFLKIAFYEACMNAGILKVD